MKAQSIAHDKLAEDVQVNVGEHTRNYWKKEALRYSQQLEEILHKVDFPESYMRKIDTEAMEKGKKLYLKKKKALTKKLNKREV